LSIEYHLIHPILKLEDEIIYTKSNKVSIKVIHHKYDPDKQLKFTEQLEHTQYKAAQAVSGASMGANRLMLIEELYD